MLVTFLILINFATRYQCNHVTKFRSFQVGRTTFVELFTAYPDTQLLFRAFHAEDVSTLESSNAALQGPSINDVCFEWKMKTIYILCISPECEQGGDKI